MPWLTTSLFSATKTLLVPAYVSSLVLLPPCHFFMNLFLYHYAVSLFLEIFFVLKSTLMFNIVTLDFLGVVVIEIFVIFIVVVVFWEDSYVENFQVYS